MAGRAFQIQELKVAPLWDESRGAGVKVAMLDSGVWCSSALPDTRIETLGLDGKPQAPTSNSHGTYCAALIASSEEDAEGAAPEAGVMSIQVISNAGNVTPESVAKGLKLALEKGCDVISCSFVLPSMAGQRDEIRDLVRQAHLAGVPVVVAAGNQKGMAADFPESIPNAIVVSAHDAAGRAMNVNANSWTDIATLGERLDVVGDSAIPAVWQGETSGAAALVSGVVALALSSVPAASRRRIGRGIEGLIKITGRPLNGPSSGTRLRLDAPALFAAVQSHL